MERKRLRRVISGQKLTQNHLLNDETGRENLEREKTKADLLEREIVLLFDLTIQFSYSKYG